MIPIKEIKAPNIHRRAGNPFKVTILDPIPTERIKPPRKITRIE